MGRMSLAHYQHQTSITINGPDGDNYPYLYLVNITPQPDHPLATTALFPYFQLSEYQYVSGNVAAGAAGNTLTSQVLSSNGIPKRVYLSVKLNPADNQSPVKHQHQIVMHSLPKLDFNGITIQPFFQMLMPMICISCLSEMDVISSWLEWSSFVGSVICINPCSDLPSFPHQASGLAERTSFQVTVTFQSINPNNATYTLFVHVIDEGIMVVNNQVVSHETNPLQVSDITNATENHGNVKISNMWGGYSYSSM